MTGTSISLAYNGYFSTFTAVPSKVSKVLIWDLCCLYFFIMEWIHCDKLLFADDMKILVNANFCKGNLMVSATAVF